MVDNYIISIYISVQVCGPAEFVHQHQKPVIAQERPLWNNGPIRPLTKTADGPRNPMLLKILHWSIMYNLQYRKNFYFWVFLKGPCFNKYYELRECWDWLIILNKYVALLDLEIVTAMMCFHIRVQYPRMLILTRCFRPLTKKLVSSTSVN